MSEKRQLAQVGEALGVWRAAGKAVLAIHDLKGGSRQPTTDEKEYFSLLMELFDYASKGATRLEGHQLVLGTDSTREYSAFLDIVGAFSTTSENSPSETPQFDALLTRLRNTMLAFSNGATPPPEDADFLSRVLRAIAMFNARQASDAFYRPLYSFSPRLP